MMVFIVWLIILVLKMRIGGGLVVVVICVVCLQNVHDLRYLLYIYTVPILTFHPIYTYRLDSFNIERRICNLFFVNLLEATGTALMKRTKLYHYVV